MMPKYVPGFSTLLDRRLREAADVRLVDDRFRQAAAQVAVALPIELVVDHHALGRAEDATLGRQEVARQGLAIGIDQPGLGIEAVAALRFVWPVGLKMVKLARDCPGNEDAPDVAPAIQIGVELDDLRWLGFVDAVVKQHPHRVALRLKTTN